MLKGTHKNLRARKLARARGEKKVKRVRSEEGVKSVKSEESEKMAVVLSLKKHTNMYA